MHPAYNYIKQAINGQYPDTEASAIAKAILTDVFQLSTTDLYASKDMNFSTNQAEKIEVIITRLRANEPLQYILGNCYFCGLNFHVEPGVLIPRPETAELVEWIIADRKSSDSPIRILDIGTGSGCISISLAKNLPQSEVYAWDISEDAIRIASDNANRLDANVRFRQTDALGQVPTDTMMNVIVSNPPYITEAERTDMDANVNDWEPDTALFVPDNAPLLFYERIAEIGKQILTPDGTLYFEINQRFGTETVDMLRQKGYRNVELRKDLSGNDRMIKAERP